MWCAILSRWARMGKGTHGPAMSDQKPQCLDTTSPPFRHLSRRYEDCFKVTTVWASAISHLNNDVNRLSWYYEQFLSTLGGVLQRLIIAAVVRISVYVMYRESTCLQWLGMGLICATIVLHCCDVCQWLVNSLIIRKIEKVLLHINSSTLNGAWDYVGLRFDWLCLGSKRMSMTYMRCTAPWLLCNTECLL